MKNYIKNFVKKYILKLKPYQSARSIGGNGHILLNANELPISKNFDLKKIPLNRYPEFQSKKLLQKYARYANINSRNILISRGSDEAIELLMKVFCISGKDGIITCPPTYTMYSKIAEIYDIKNITIPLLDNKKLDLKSLKLNIKYAKLIYICRPNNPTGYVINFKDIIKILDLTFLKLIVVIDEAYIEFCYQNNLIYLLCQYPNLVILRTLSKAFGLAGIRCGFTIAHPDVITLLKKVIPPYPLSSLSIEIAIQALSLSNIQIMKNEIVELKKNKVWLLNELKSIKLIDTIYDSETNYILVKFFHSDDVFNALWNIGIILRNQSDQLGLLGCIRISIGTKEECLELVKALKSII